MVIIRLRNHKLPRSDQKHKTIRLSRSHQSTRHQNKDLEWHRTSISRNTNDPPQEKAEEKRTDIRQNAHRNNHGIHNRTTRSKGTDRWTGWRITYAHEPGATTRGERGLNHQMGDNCDRHRRPPPVSDAGERIPRIYSKRRYRGAEVNELFPRHSIIWGWIFWIRQLKRRVTTNTPESPSNITIVAVM